jgi:hypothetical protein
MRVEMASLQVHTFFKYVQTRDGYIQCTVTVLYLVPTPYVLVSTIKCLTL